MYAFFIFSSKLFLGFFTNSKTENRENFQNRLQLNIYRKTFFWKYLKGSQNGLVWSEWKYFFLRFQMFVFSLEYAEEH